MRHPLRENLEIADAAGTDWIFCTRCQFKYCRADQDWREFCKVRLLPPNKAGSLMSILEGQYLMRQLYCPSCAALLDTDFVDTKPHEKEA
jgi:acetone carboxylase gamma subunit